MNITPRLRRNRVLALLIGGHLFSPDYAVSDAAESATGEGQSSGRELRYSVKKHRLNDDEGKRVAKVTKRALLSFVWGRVSGRRRQLH